MPALRSIPVRLGRWRSSPQQQPEGPGTACVAPETALYFNTDGNVRTCCMNESYPLGNIVEQRLPEIWAGQRRRKLIDALAKDDFSLGCSVCTWQSDHESAEASYARRFDEFIPDAAGTHPDDQWPAHIEFNLSNSCNLQCVQCHGGLSSSIRIHREKLPALPTVYDDQFFEDLVPFITHARSIQVAGGEPFLGPETLRLWDLLIEHGQHADIAVVTNGTQWSKRVQRIIDALPMVITVSIDGITKDVYESIRIGSNFDDVLVNIERFLDYTRRVDTWMSFNFCLMVQNYQDFGDLLLFADARGIKVNVSVVYRPVECSLGDLDADTLGRICDELDAQSLTILPQLGLNADLWTDHLSRLRQRHQFRLESGHDPTLNFVGVPDTYVLGIAQRGKGPHDEQTAVDRLRADDPEADIHWLTIGVGDQITATSPAAAAVLGFTDDALIGETGEAIRQRMEERLGAIAGFDILDQSDDHLDQVVTYGTTPMRSTAVALRDDDGWADEVRLLFIAPPAV